MTIVSMDGDGVAAVAAALRRGEAVIIPFPSPLPYCVAATTAAAVNEAKGRGPGQPCGILASGAEDVAPHLDLDEETAALAVWITQVERANVFVPVRPTAPRWLASGAVDGVVGITLAWLPQTRPLADEFAHLFVSSGNRTGGRVGVTAAEVDDIFAGRRLVLDGDPYRDTSAEQGSATIIEVRPSRRLRIVREGVNNRDFAGAATAYLARLLLRFDRARDFRPGGAGPEGHGDLDALR